MTVVISLVFFLMHRSPVKRYQQMLTNTPRCMCCLSPKHQVRAASPHRVLPCDCSSSSKPHRESCVHTPDPSTGHLDRLLSQQVVAGSSGGAVPSTSWQWRAPFLFHIGSEKAWGELSINMKVTRPHGENEIFSVFPYQWSL